MSYKTKTPEAYIAVNKGRVKFYPANEKNKVYLQDGQEFQIELFNPTTNNVKAVISLNGYESPSGIVLKPGQRYFLDRFVEEPKKLKFDTYEIEDSSEAKAATAQNGAVTVKFYNEKKKVYVPPVYTYTTQLYNSSSPLRGGTGDFTNHVYGNMTLTSLSSTVNDVSMDSLVGGTLDNAFDSELEFFPQGMKKSIETGRVEKGDKSDQTFIEVDMDFEFFSFTWVNYTLLPESQKPIQVEDLIKKHCTNCGSKIKQKDNFCGACGDKL